MMSLIRPLGAACFLFSLGACSSSDMPAAMSPPPSQGASAPPAMALTPHRDLESLSTVDSPGMPLLAQASVNQTAQVQVQSNGFVLSLPDGQTAAIDTSANAADRLGPDHYEIRRATTGTDMAAIGVIAHSLNYATYGLWNEVSHAPPLELTPTATLYFTQFDPAAGAFAFGTQTTAAQMPASGTAIFSGAVTGFYFNPMFEVISAGMITGGTVTLNANFSANSIAGAITGITSQSSANLGDIALNAGIIAGAAFNGTATMAANAATRLVGGSGTFGGRFYGPAATEVAGTFILMNSTGSAVVAAGAFGAKR